MTKQEQQEQLNDLYSEKQNLLNELQSSDYKVIKCAEDKARGVAKADLPYDIDALHEERQGLRDRINVAKDKIATLEQEKPVEE